MTNYIIYYLIKHKNTKKKGSQFPDSQTFSFKYYLIPNFFMILAIKAVRATIFAFNAVI